MSHPVRRAFPAILIALSGLASCDGSSSPTAPTNPGSELNIGVCAPGAGPFSASIDHPYFLLPVGTSWTLEGVEDGETLTVVVTSLPDTEVVAGVVTRVVEERETKDGELAEVSRNFFVRAPDGTVCYYGEDVDIYEGGAVVSHDGAWRAGGNNQPGIFMPADPRPGQSFRQEVAPGVAMDQATVLAAGETVTVPFGTFMDTLRIEDFNPLDGDRGEKVYARGAGLLVDGAARRVR